MLKNKTKITIALVGFASITLLFFQNFINLTSNQSMTNLQNLNSQLANAIQLIDTSYMNYIVGLEGRPGRSAEIEMEMNKMRSDLIRVAEVSKSISTTSTYDLTTDISNHAAHSSTLNALTSIPRRRAYVVAVSGAPASATSVVNINVTGAALATGVYPEVDLIITSSYRNNYVINEKNVRVGNVHIFLTINGFSNVNENKVSINRFPMTKEQSPTGQAVAAGTINVLLGDNLEALYKINFLANTTTKAIELMDRVLKAYPQFDYRLAGNYAITSGTVNISVGNDTALQTVRGALSVFIDGVQTTPSQLISINIGSIFPSNIDALDAVNFCKAYSKTIDSTSKSFHEIKWRGKTLCQSGHVSNFFATPAHLPFGYPFAVFSATVNGESVSVPANTLYSFGKAESECQLLLSAPYSSSKEIKCVWGDKVIREQEGMGTAEIFVAGVLANKDFITKTMLLSRCDSYAKSTPSYNVVCKFNNEEVYNKIFPPPAPPSDPSLGTLVKFVYSSYGGTYPYQSIYNLKYDSALAECIKPYSYGGGTISKCEWQGKMIFNAEVLQPVSVKVNGADYIYHDYLKLNYYNAINHCKAILSSLWSANATCSWSGVLIYSITKDKPLTIFDSSLNKGFLEIYIGSNLFKTSPKCDYKTTSSCNYNVVPLNYDQAKMECYTYKQIVNTTFPNSGTYRCVWNGKEPWAGLF